jgi:hypothetical protein
MCGSRSPLNQNYSASKDVPTQPTTYETSLHSEDEVECAMSPLLDLNINTAASNLILDSMDQHILQ